MAKKGLLWHDDHWNVVVMNWNLCYLIMIVILGVVRPSQVGLKWLRHLNFNSTSSLSTYHSHTSPSKPIIQSIFHIPHSKARVSFDWVWIDDALHLFPPPTSSFFTWHFGSLKFSSSLLIVRLFGLELINSFETSAPSRCLRVVIFYPVWSTQTDLFIWNWNSHWLHVS